MGRRWARQEVPRTAQAGIQQHPRPIVMKYQTPRIYAAMSQIATATHCMSYARSSVVYVALPLQRRSPQQRRQVPPLRLHRLTQRRALRRCLQNSQRWGLQRAPVGTPPVNPLCHPATAPALTVAFLAGTCRRPSRILKPATVMAWIQVAIVSTGPI